MLKGVKKLKKISVFAALILIAMMFTSCGSFSAAKYAKTGKFADYDLAYDLGIMSVLPSHIGSGENAEIGNLSNLSDSNYTGDQTAYRMKVYKKMDLYKSIGAETPFNTLENGTVVDLKEIASSNWAQVYDTEGTLLGFAKDGFMHAIDSDLEVYAELPIEYGKAKTNAETYVDAYSHLVDIRKYFKVYSSTDPSNDGVDLSKYDIKVSMQLSTPKTTINEPFYNSNICMVQYDMIPKLKEAVELFRKDGYMLVIYDAYRPTSVQQRWFDVVKVHAWVANPAIGMGGVHDRGTALDISLIDIDTGKELEMPTPMHTFTEESSRNYPHMTGTAVGNMNYLLSIMVACDYTYINSEWWHFQTADTQNYLPTDHPIDSIPLVPSEKYN